MGSHSDKHRVKPLGEDVVQVVHAGVQPQFHPQIHDVLHLPIHDPGREAVLGHPHAQHTAGHGQRLEDGDPVPEFTQVLGGGKSAGAPADDRHALLVPALGRLRRHPGLGVDLIGDETLQGPDVDRLVQFAPVAGILAAVIADTAADAGEGIVLFNYP